MSNRFDWFVTGSAAASVHLAIGMAVTAMDLASDTVPGTAGGIVAGTAVTAGNQKRGRWPPFDCGATQSNASASESVQV
jgi:hypothetical protein